MISPAITDRHRFPDARMAFAALTVGALAGLGATFVSGAAAAAPVGLIAAVSLMLGDRLGERRSRAQARLRHDRATDELVEYQAFTRLLRAQAERISGMTGDAARVIAEGLREIDDRAERLAKALGNASENQCDAEAVKSLKIEAEAIGAPIMTMLAELQFQDVTQQQLMFLSRLSLLLDDHIAELRRMMDDHRSPEPATRFKDLFDAALGDTVMASQRNDHHSAQGAGLEEDSGPMIELFADKGATG